MPKKVEILLVDDSPEDIELTMEALQEFNLADNVSVVHDGEAAMAYLHREGNYKLAPRPSLIFLDLNMPKMDGREVLDQIKSNENLKDIVVVILTTSSDEVDIKKSYKGYANCYVTKPNAMSQFMKAIQSIDDFWFGVAKLPKAD